MSKLLVATLFLSLFGVLYCSYNENFARYTLWPMASSTFSEHPELCIKDNFKNASLIRQYTLLCDLAKVDTCSGFTAVSYSDKAIILAFRGSVGWFQEVEEGFDGIFENKTKFIGGGGVNAYFYGAFQNVWNAGMRDDFLATKNAHPEYALWITGHSLGGAMASLCAGYISKLGYVHPNNIKLVTYGQPRTGNLAYADYIDSTLPYVYRIVHAHDLVPHLPPLSLEFVDDLKNYTHHRSEVWYNNDMVVGSTFVECDENESDKCNNQLERNLFDLKASDHDYYFNTSYWFAENGCPGYNPYKFGVSRVRK